MFMMRLFRRIRKALSLIRNAGYRRGLRVGVGAAIEHERILKSLLCRTVVDVGANRGQFALVARGCFPDAKIHSFEPLAGPREQFGKVFSGDANVALYPLALGDEVGEQTIHVSARDDSSSLLPIGDLQSQLFPGTAEARQETISISTLERVIGAKEIVHPALLKLDVQGYELSALQGCGELLRRFRYIYVECSFVELYEGQALASEIVAYLLARNFKLNGAYNLHYDPMGIAVQCDLLFESHADGVPH
tara:strand:- start:15741 stop:16487 length:747 start_codon:yes stop_codon:yes gene_type:complete